MPVAAVEAPIQVDHTQVSNYPQSVERQFATARVGAAAAGRNMGVFAEED
jgi:hypothetical protein